jgi:hypothetical protein
MERGTASLSDREFRAPERRERVHVVVVWIVQLDRRCAHYEIEQRSVFALHVLIVTRIVPMNNRN